MRFTYCMLVATSAVLLWIPSGSGDGSGRATSHADDAITLQGTINSVEIARVNPQEFFLHINLDLTLVNTHSVSLIFLTAERPENLGGNIRMVRHPYLVGGLLVKEPGIATRREALADNYYGPSDTESPELELLRTSLNLPRPPTDKVRILMPNEEWRFEDVLLFSLRFKDEPMCKGGEVCPPAGWETIRPLKVVWIRAYLEIWPTNLEPHPLTGKDPFGHMLRKRWQKYGVLQLDTVVSEPIRFDLSGITIGTSH